MDSFIRLLHCAVEREIKETPECFKIIEKLDELTKDLTGKQLEFINELAFLHGDLEQEIAAEHFAAGFKIGFKLALEALNSRF